MTLTMSKVLPLQQDVHPRPKCITYIFSQTLLIPLFHMHALIVSKQNK